MSEQAKFANVKIGDKVIINGDDWFEATVIAVDSGFFEAMGVVFRKSDGKQAGPPRHRAYCPDEKLEHSSRITNEVAVEKAIIREKVRIRKRLNDVAYGLSVDELELLLDTALKMREEA